MRSWARVSSFANQKTQGDFDVKKCPPPTNQPKPILSATLIAEAQKELGENASISDAMALCNSRYQASPEFKAAKLEEKRQATALREERAAIAVQEKEEERESRRNDYESVQAADIGKSKYGCGR